MEKLPDSIVDILNEYPIILVDAGARGGFAEIRRLASWTHAYGFEPHPKSFDVLNDARPAKTNKYAQQHFLPLALGKTPGMRHLLLTHNPSYSSFLPVDERVYDRHLRFMPQYPDWKRDITPIGQAPVQVTTLDLEATELHLPGIDLLKLDTQGTELEILEGGSALFDRKAIGVIKCEVSFIPFYTGQGLFSDVDRFLRERGWLFVDCRHYPEVKNPFTKKTGRYGTPVPGLTEQVRYATVGDAVYVRDPGLQPNPLLLHSLLKNALILAAMGYLGPAYELLQQIDTLSNGDRAAALRFLARRSRWELLKKLIKSWRRCI